MANHGPTRIYYSDWDMKILLHYQYMRSVEEIRVLCVGNYVDDVVKKYKFRMIDNNFSCNTSEVLERVALKYDCKLIYVSTSVQDNYRLLSGNSTFYQKQEMLVNIMNIPKCVDSLVNMMDNYLIHGSF